MPFLPRRILETFLVEISLSAAYAFLFYSGVLSQIRKTVIISMFLLLLVNFVILFIFARGYIFSVRNLGAYYLVNVLTMLLLTAASAVTAYFDTEPIYTWLFAPFKLFYFWFDFPKWLSAAAVGGLFLFVTAIIPIFVRVPKKEIN